MTRPFAVTPFELSKALDIPEDRIRALAAAGYLLKIPHRNFDGNSNDYRIARSKPPKHLPMRVVDRISIALWLLGLDQGRQPAFNLYIEKEIMRIAQLPIMQRTEQAVRMIRRYRDAEAIVVAINKLRAKDIAAIEIRILSDKHKHAMATLAGLLSSVDREEHVHPRQPLKSVGFPVPRKRPSPPASAKSRPAGRAG